MFKNDLFLVLMFHKISIDRRDGLTITIDDFQKYIAFLRRHHFNFLRAEEVVRILNKTQEPPVSPSVLITFDDGYEETFQLIEQNSAQLDIPITCFVPVKYMGGENEWDEQKEKLLDWSEVSSLSEKNTVDFGLHSFEHNNYSKLTATEIRQDIQNCKKHWQSVKYFSELLAYPYGAFNKKAKAETAKALKEEGIAGAFRIGNRRNYWSQLEPYFIQRIDIRGDQSYFRNILRIFGIRL